MGIKPRCLSAICLCLAPALSVLMLLGCAKARRVTLYLPEDGELRASAARIEDDPRALVTALTEAGALPEAEWSYLYCESRSEDYALAGETCARAVVHLDIADALGGALRQMDDERASVQALANTFLDYYGAEIFVLTVEGVNLQTLRVNYDHGITFDEYARTRAN